MHETKLTRRVCDAYAYVSLDWLAQTELPSFDKAVFLLERALQRSTLYYNVWRRYRRLRIRFPEFSLPGWPGKPAFAPVDAVAKTRRLIARLGTLERGTATFVHLLLPHGPYVYDARCRLRVPSSQWGAHGNPQDHGKIESVRRVDRLEYGKYLEQSRCALDLVGQMLTAIETNPGLMDAHILVHGDHGSRISVTEGAVSRGSPEAWGEVGNQGWEAAHSVLFAVRTPAIRPAYVPAPRPLPELFRRWWLMPELQDNRTQSSSAVNAH